MVNHGYRHTHPLHGGPQAASTTAPLELEASARIAFVGHQEAVAFKEALVMQQNVVGLEAARIGLCQSRSVHDRIVYNIGEFVSFNLSIVLISLAYSMHHPTFFLSSSCHPNSYS
jgi:hypothetical protein